MIIKMLLHLAVAVLISLGIWAGISYLYMLLFGINNGTIVAVAIGMLSGIYLGVNYLNKFGQIFVDEESSK